MRFLIAIGAASLLCSAAAQAASSFDPKGLARYDVGYIKCEAKYPEMKGHRDEAYLSLWRLKAEDKYLQRLAKVRGSAEYRAEKQRAQQAAGKSASSPASSPLNLECQGLWGEYQSNKPASR